MSGRARLPGGNPLRASQRGRRAAAPAPTVVAPTWRAGDRVRWKDYVGSYLRDAGGGEVEIMVGVRTYRVAVVELRSA